MNPKIIMRIMLKLKINPNIKNGLILNNNDIEYRQSDVYINETQLCKDVYKLFYRPYRLDST